MPGTEAMTAEDTKFLAEAKRQEAEAAKLEQERLRAAAETDLARAAATQAALTLERDQYRRRLELATDEHHLFYAFNGQIDMDTVSHCIDVLTTWDRLRPDEPIEIQFNSPGGSMVAGFALWDHIQFVKNRGHQVTTSTIGVAASMAGVLLQAGHERVMGAESWLLIHEGSMGAVGKIADVEDTIEWSRRMRERILNIFAKRANLSADEIRAKWERRDWWLDSSESLELGFIDRIRS